MNINNFKITKNEPRINKYKGIKLEDDRVPYILDNYTQIKEVKELPSLEYTGEVYISGSLTNKMMTQDGITENPVDKNIFLSAVTEHPGSELLIFPSYDDLPKNPVEKEVEVFYITLKEQKLYFYSSTDSKYYDYTSELIVYNIVYIGTDKSLIGTMDIDSEIDGVQGTIGCYIIASEPEDVSTSTIYKKEIMTTTEPVNEWYMFGDKCQVITSEYLESNEFLNIVQKHTEKLPNFGLGWLYLPYFVPTNMTNTTTNISEKNLSNDSDYTFYYKDSGPNHHPDLAVEYNKTFDNINELKNWLLLDEEYKIWEEANDEPYDTTNSINLMREYFKTSKEKDGIDATPIYTDKLDTSLDLTQIPFYIVMAKGEPKGTGVYQYYIYNGKEYIELGGKSGGATENIVKEINITSLSINDAIQAMNNITFTKEETIKLSTTSNLVILTNIDDGDTVKAQVVNSFYNKEVMSGNENLIIIFNDSYNLLFEQANLVLTIQKDVRDENIYYLNSTITPSIDIQIGNIQVSDWIEDTTYSTFGYNYKCEFTPSGLDGNLYINYAQINVIFGMEEAVSGNFAPYVTVEKRFFTIYAKEKPTKDIMFNYEVVSR